MPYWGRWSTSSGKQQQPSADDAVHLYALLLNTVTTKARGTGPAHT